MPGWRRSLALSAALATTLLGSVPRADAAPTFVVNGTDDLPKAPGNEAVCETAPSNGVCTLRAAVMAANRVPGGRATIRVPAGVYVLTIPGAEDAHDDATGNLDLLQGVTIVGDGPSTTLVDGGSLTQIFFLDHSAATGDVRIEGMMLRNGFASAGGAIGEQEVDGVPPKTILENLVLAANVATAGGAVFENGLGSLAIRHCIVRDNTATNGGGLYLLAGTSTVSDSLIQGNQAMQNGGGAYLAAPATVERTSILGNTTLIDGGGIYISGSAAIVNSTFDSNIAAGGGGGIHAAAGTTTLISDTIAANKANAGHGYPPTVVSGGWYGGGVGVAAGATVTIRNSVVASNTSDNFGDSGSGADEIGPQPAHSLDYNLCARIDACTLDGVLTHVNTVTMLTTLAALGNHGGFALDRSPSLASPLVDAVPPASCIDALGGPLVDDGRGLARAGSCDIGALQTKAAYAPVTLLGVELIRNGGATGNELGEAARSGDLSVAPRYWMPYGGNPTLAVYGTTRRLPEPPDVPGGSGAYLFTGGPDAIDGTSVQRIDLSGATGAIDAGSLPYRLSGAFGGFATEDDSAALTLDLLDDADAVLATVTIGGFTAADRGGVTELLPDTAAGTVPPGTRFAMVTLKARLAAGPSNDGFADDLSLRLPEPADGGAAWALAALGVVAWRRASMRRTRTTVAGRAR